MEHARGAGARDGRRAAAVDADGQADQCRFSLRGLDTPGQHHDTGTGPAPGTGCDLATAAATPDGSRALGGQEAAKTPGCAGSACARTTSGAHSGSRARSLKQLILCAIPIICTYSDRKTAIHSEINRRDRFSRKIR